MRQVYTTSNCTEETTVGWCPRQAGGQSHCGTLVVDLFGLVGVHRRFEHLMHTRNYFVRTKKNGHVFLLHLAHSKRKTWHRILELTAVLLEHFKVC